MGLHVIDARVQSTGAIADTYTERHRHCHSLHCHIRSAGGGDHTSVDVVVFEVTGAEMRGWLAFAGRKPSEPR